MLGMSMRGLGRAVGLASAQLQKYERGTSEVTLVRLHEFARVLGVPVSYFFEGLAPPGRPRARSKGFGVERRSSDQALSDRQVREFVCAYYMIRKTLVRKRIHQVVVALAEPGHVQVLRGSKGGRKRD
jgi:transcriptional regulator with XRE-family HTH domain